jgi:hypothetical protein
MSTFAHQLKLLGVTGWCRVANSFQELFYMLILCQSSVLLVWIDSSLVIVYYLKISVSYCIDWCMSVPAQATGPPDLLMRGTGFGAFPQVLPWSRLLTSTSPRARRVSNLPPGPSPAASWVRLLQPPGSDTTTWQVLMRLKPTKHSGPGAQTTVP